MQKITLTGEQWKSVKHWLDLHDVTSAGQLLMRKLEEVNLVDDELVEVQCTPSEIRRLAAACTDYGIEDVPEEVFAY